MALFNTKLACHSPFRPFSYYFCFVSLEAQRLCVVCFWDITEITEYCRGGYSFMTYFKMISNTWVLTWKSFKFIYQVDKPWINLILPSKEMKYVAIIKVIMLMRPIHSVDNIKQKGAQDTIYKINARRKHI